MTAAAETTRRVDVLGVGISIVDLTRAVDQVEAWVDAGEHRYICASNVHTVMECQRDPALLDIHNRSGLTLPDGAPLLWAGRFVGAPMGRVRGSDFLSATSQRAAEQGWRCFFYGAGPGTAERVAQRLSERFPDLQVAGCYSPPYRPLTEAEDRDVVDMINASRANVVWVSLSAPKQERWMAAHVDRLEANVAVGVGAAFDFHAGLVREAPRWMQNSGLEWVYRLSREPRRLWRRYLGSNPAFVAGLLRQRPYVREVEPDG